MKKFKIIKDDKYYIVQEQGIIFWSTWKDVYKNIILFDNTELAEDCIRKWCEIRFPKQKINIIKE